LSEVQAVHRTDIKAAIVAAAEALYQRGGAEAVTLSAVAREADFARGVIYGHFASRQELLAAVVPPGEPVPEVSEREDRDDYDSLMRAQAEALQELTKQVVVPKTRTATDMALSRLDARLVVAENSIKALESRMGERLKSLDIDTGAVSERLHGLRQRLEKFEEKQTAALAQLRLDVHNLRHGQPSAEQRFLIPEPLPEPLAEDEPAAETETGATEAETPSEPASASSLRIAAYLALARQSANEAAARRAAMPQPPKPAWLKFVGKRRWALLAVAGALVLWFDIYVFAHYQPAEGGDVPVATAAQVPPTTVKPEWSPRVQLVRGLRYLNGVGVPADRAKARLWIERAALRGHPVASNLMGVMYQTGNGVAVNMPVAIGWYEGAADRGNLKAMANLGRVYAGGWPDATDFAKASEWFAKAAAFGDIDAAFNLAVLYERGEGVVRNLPQAYKWYRIAGKLGDKNAAARAKTLASELSVEERDAADGAAAAFRPRPIDRAANETPAING
jgi:TPR repeat protein